MAPKTKNSQFSTWMTLAILAAIASGLWVYGQSFYRLSLEAKASHARFRELAPTGRLGLLYGYIGLGLVLTNLLYLVRRKLAAYHIGSLKSWLNMHVFTGLVGPVVVVFHSAFQLRNTVAAMALWSLTVLVCTGIIGRYLYAVAPAADALRLAAYLDVLEVHANGLGRDLKVFFERNQVTQLRQRPTLWAAVRLLPTWIHEMSTRTRWVHKYWKARRVAMRPEVESEIVDVVRQVAKIARAEVRSVMGKTLLQVWRPLHRFFAILMVLAVGLHVGIAWYYGYQWIRP